MEISNIFHLWGIGFNLFSRIFLGLGLTPRRQGSYWIHHSTGNRWLFIGCSVFLKQHMLMGRVHRYLESEQAKVSSVKFSAMVNLIKVVKLFRTKSLYVQRSANWILSASVHDSDIWKHYNSGFADMHGSVTLTLRCNVAEASREKSLDLCGYCFWQKNSQMSPCVITSYALRRSKLRSLYFSFLC